MSRTIPPYRSPSVTHVLRILWRHGRTSDMPAKSLSQALARQEEVHLRADMMDRLYVVDLRDNTERVLWDVTWEQDLLKMPRELHAKLFLNAQHYPRVEVAS